MFTLVFNGEFQLEYPGEFLEDLEQLKSKHNVVFHGKPIIRDIGNYVDFQKIDDESIVEEQGNEQI